MCKYYCDKCGAEMQKHDSGRLKRKLGRFQVEVMTCVHGVWNSGHLCHKCVVDIVNDGDTKKDTYSEVSHSRREIKP